MSKCRQYPFLWIYLFSFLQTYFTKHMLIVFCIFQITIKQYEKKEALTLANFHKHMTHSLLIWCHRKKTALEIREKERSNATTEFLRMLVFFLNNSHSPKTKTNSSGEWKNSLGESEQLSIYPSYSQDWRIENYKLWRVV